MAQKGRLVLSHRRPAQHRTRPSHGGGCGASQTRESLFIYYFHYHFHLIQLTHLLIKQIKTWFCWCAYGSRRGCLQQKQTSVFEKAIEPKGTRVRTHAELYILEHYDDRIKHQFKAKQEAGNIPEDDNLNVVRKFSQQCLDTEDDDVKGKIQQMYELQEKKPKTGTTEPEEEMDPVEIQQRVFILLGLHKHGRHNL
jgi:hypothetical protein